MLNRNCSNVIYLRDSKSLVDYLASLSNSELNLLADLILKRKMELKNDTKN